MLTLRTFQAHPATRYAVALLVTAIAWLVTIALEPKLSSPNYLPFAAAVAVATWFGGVGPGLLTSILCVGAIDFSFLPPYRSIELSHSEELLDTAVFVVVALIVSATTGALRRARLIADAAQRTAERSAERATKLLAVTSALSEAGSVEDVTRVVLDMGLPLVEATRGYLARVEGDRIDVLGSRGYGELGAQPRNGGGSRDGPLADAIGRRTPLWLASADEYRTSYPHAFARVGAVSEQQAHAAIPLIHGGEVVGGLGISFASPAAVGARDRAFPLLLAQAAAAALQRARSYDEEREKRREAEVLTRAREEVLGMVAHDLRNPLHLMSATAELLADADQPLERRRQLAGITGRATQQMSRLVTDLLDTARMQAGRLTLDVADVALGALVEQAVENMRPLAEDRGIHLAVQLTGAELLVHADAARVQQALGNLLGNALKFTERGGRVTLRAHPGDGCVVFAVEDTGPGISADRLPRLFEQFWQARVGDRRGVGLGLSIAKGIVDAHGGRIWVESTPGQGTTFWFTIPSAEPRVHEEHTRRVDARVAPEVAAAVAPEVAPAGVSSASQ